MKVIVFGRRRTVQKLVVFLAGEGIEVVGISDGLDEMIALHKQIEFDLAIVDSQAETAEAACHHLKEFRDTPLVLIVNQKQVDWARLQPLNADVYLSEEAKNGELVARLRAVLRRFWPAGQVKKVNLMPNHPRMLTESYHQFYG